MEFEGVIIEQLETAKGTSKETGEPWQLKVMNAILKPSYLMYGMEGMDELPDSIWRRARNTSCL